MEHIDTTFGEKELVSIITPLYNSLPFLKETIESVLKQTYTHWQWIVIDDASSDASVSCIEEYEDSRIIVLKNEENLGPAKTRNKGLLRAEGQYIAFLDSDDLWEPNKLKIQIEGMQKEDIPLSYTAHHKINEKNELGIYYPAIEKLNYAKMLKANFMRFSSVVYDRNALKLVLIPDIRKRQDYAMCLKMLRMTKYALGINQPLLHYRCVPGSVSNSGKLHLIRYNWLVFKHCEKLGYLTSSLAVMNNIFYKLFIKK